MSSNICKVFPLFILLTSCSYFFGKQDANNNKNFYNLTFDEKASLSCVKDNTPLLRDYFNMVREDKQIALDLVAMKNCLHDALDMFVRHTKGSQQGGDYSASDLHEFLSQSFTEYTYDLAFMQEAFQLKESLLGGPSTTVNKDDIAALLKYIDFLYDKLAFHAADRRVLFSDKASEDRVTDRAQFLAASEAFQKSLAEFKTLPRKSEGDFKFTSSTNLITYFLDDANKADWTNVFKVINSAQALVAHGQPDVIDTKKLPFVIDNLGTIYLGYIEFQKFLKNKSFYTDLSTTFTFPGLLNALIKSPESFAGDNVEILNHIQKNILGPIKNAVAAAPNQEMELRYIYSLVDTFEEIKALPSYTQGKTLKAMVPEFFGRWLTPGSCTVACKATVLGVSQVDLLLKIVDEWKERQLWVNQISRSQRASEPFVVGARGREASLNLQNFRNILGKMSYVHWEDYVVIGSHEVNYKDASIFNSLYTLVSIFTRPYNENRRTRDIYDYYLNESETVAFFDWIKDIGIELKIIDPRASSTGGTAFIEINLFGSASYNPDEMNFTEMLEYLEISFSTGLRSVYLMENEFVSCRLSKNLDVFEFERLKPDCVRPLFKQNIEPYLISALPGMNNYLKTNPAANLDLMYTNLEKSARQGMIADIPMDTDMFRLSSSIGQYVESLFLRFDANNDDVIDSTEVQAVMDHIVPNIRKLVKSNLPDSVEGPLYFALPNFERDAVTYILRYKELPDILKAENLGGELWGGATLTWGNLTKWATGGSEWLASDDVQIHREDFLLVISGLSYFQRIQRTKKIKDVFVRDVKLFDTGIADSQASSFEDILAQTQCSVKIKSQVHDWLFSNQKAYWVKAQVDQILNIFGWSITGSSIWFHEDLSSRWSTAVALKLIDLLYNEPQIGPFCNLPYVQGVQLPAEK